MISLPRLYPVSSVSPINYALFSSAKGPFNTNVLVHLHWSRAPTAPANSCKSFVTRRSVTINGPRGYVILSSAAGTVAHRRQGLRKSGSGARGERGARYSLLRRHVSDSVLTLARPVFVFEFGIQLVSGHDLVLMFFFFLLKTAVFHSQFLLTLSESAVAIKQLPTWNPK